jgi:hypothetical protein
MPLLHRHSHSFLERIFNRFADFATDFGDGTIMSKSHPITKLNTKALVPALTVMKTFCNQVNLHQATMTPVTVILGVVSVYSISRGLHPSLWTQEGQ